MNVLVIVAHHDDLEIGCGATVAKLIDRGHKVTSLVMTHSGYSDCKGMTIRNKQDAMEGAYKASKILNYELISYEADSLDLEINDENRCRIIKIIQNREIDFIFTHFNGDINTAHNNVLKMALNASRHVPTVLGLQINWYLGDKHFVPKLFVSVNENQWERKISALKCYGSEFKRIGNKWVEYLNNLSINYGTQIGVERAEAFYIYKFSWKF